MHYEQLYIYWWKSILVYTYIGGRVFWCTHILVGMCSNVLVKIYRWKSIVVNIYWWKSLLVYTYIGGRV